MTEPDRFRYLTYDAPVKSILRDVPAGSITIYGDGTYVARDAKGAETLRIDAPPVEQRHTLDFGACDCCERLPAGTVADVLALLPDAHPAAQKLREATGG